MQHDCEYYPYFISGSLKVEKEPYTFLVVLVVSGSMGEVRSERPSSIVSIFDHGLKCQDR